jgi:hypothetical protein
MDTCDALPVGDDIVSMLSNVSRMFDLDAWDSDAGSCVDRHAQHVSESVAETQHVLRKTHVHPQACAPSAPSSDRGRSSAPASDAVLASHTWWAQAAALPASLGTAAHEPDSACEAQRASVPATHAEDGEALADMERVADMFADAHPWARDPITLTCVVDPYLASDGQTYSLHSLMQAMTCDPLHRSPVTGEVLRDVAFFNAFVAALVPTGAAGPPKPAMRLYDRHACFAQTAAGCHDDESAMQELVTTVTVQAPLRMSVAASVQRLRWRLPEQFSVTYHVIGRKLVYPPAFANAVDDVKLLARVLGIDSSVTNPECLTWAMLSTGTTVEEHWARNIGCTQHV